MKLFLRRRWVMSFERSNLELAVRQRTSADIAANVSELIAARHSGGPLEPTIVYTITRGDAEKVAQVLEARPACSLYLYATRPATNRPELQPAVCWVRTEIRLLRARRPLPLNRS